MKFGLRASLIVVSRSTTTVAGADGIGGVNQRLPLTLSQRAVVDEGVDLVDEGTELTASSVGLPSIN